jgi:hypothetical protein
VIGCAPYYLRERLHADARALEQADLLVEDDVVSELDAPLVEERGELLVALTRPDEDHQVAAGPHVVVERGDRACP